MSRILVVLAAVLFAVPLAVGVPTAGAPAAVPAGFAPVAQVSPEARCQDDGKKCQDKDGKHKAVKKKHGGDDIDVSKLSDDDKVGAAAVAEVLVIAALAAAI